VIRTYPLNKSSRPRRLTLAPSSTDLYKKKINLRPRKNKDSLKTQPFSSENSPLAMKI